MKIRRRSKTLAKGTGVVLATAGLSACTGNGDIVVGDPVPPPLQCNAVDEGETLFPTGTVTGTELRVSIRNAAQMSWATVEVGSVVGGTARPVARAEPLVVVIDLADANVTAGAFTLSGSLRRLPGELCPVTRRFTFTIAPSGVVVALAGELPLPARQQARIELLSREGHDVELRAATPFQGPQSVSWQVSGGVTVAQDGPRLRWRLPAEPGLYQAELVIDYGPRGLSFDTLVLEVL